MNRYSKYINTFFVVTPMTFCMALIAVVRGVGFADNWLSAFLKAWLTMLPIAYALAFVILPFAKKITDRITRR